MDCQIEFMLIPKRQKHRKQFRGVFRRIAVKGNKGNSSGNITETTAIDWGAQKARMVPRSKRIDAVLPFMSFGLIPQHTNEYDAIYAIA